LFKKIHKFNYYFDFISRIIKLILVFVVIFFIIWKWPYIDWQSTTGEFIAEQTPLKIAHTASSTSTITEVIDYSNIYQNSKIIFTVDKPYDVSEKRFTIDKMLIKGKPNYKQPFSYAGAKIRIVHISEKIGLLITGRGAEGPVLRGIDCVVE